jgi:hypothetical protein
VLTVARTRLPNRRPNNTASFHWPPEGDRRIHATAGFDPATGRVRELFLRGGRRTGSEIDHLLDDVAVLISWPLRHGGAPAEIARGLGRLPAGAPASLAGAAVDMLELESATPRLTRLLTVKGHEIEARWRRQGPPARSRAGFSYAAANSDLSHEQQPNSNRAADLPPSSLLQGERFIAP